MPAYVIYARKSSESEDRQVLSIDSQIQELHALASRRGVRVAEVLTEARSAKAPGRPVFGSLMKKIAHGEIRGVICWKMDRLSRNHLDTGAILQALADGRLDEVVTSDRTYTRDGNDRFMGNFELGMATKYIDDLRANVRRGNRARLTRGWLTHAPPLGYLLDPVSKTIVKDPDRFDLVRRMWELLLTGTFRPEQIRRIANEDWGFRTRRTKRVGGNPICPSHLYTIFGNPFYMGIIRLRSGETFVGAHPPMIGKEEFDRAQVLLGRPGRPRPKTHEFPFTGLMRCGNCGASVTAEEHVKRSGKHYVYYHCTRRKPGVTCREPAISSSDLETQMLRLLVRLAIPEKILAWLLTHVSRQIGKEQEQMEAARAMLQDSLDQLSREGENLLSLRLRDLVSDELYVRRKKDLDDRRVALEAKLKTPARSREEVVELTAGVFKFAARVADAFRSGTTVQKRMILESVGSNYTLRARKVAWTLTNPFNLIAEKGAFSNWWACMEDVRKWIATTEELWTLPDLDAANALVENTSIRPSAALAGK